MNDQNTLVKFAEKIGKLEAGLANLTTHFTNHLSDHKVDRVMQWVIIGLQVIVILFLGSQMLS